MRLVVTLCLCAIVPSGGVVVSTSLGDIQGTTTGSADQFLGIPFAEPPVNALRWEDPVDYMTPYPSSGLDATAYGNICFQSNKGGTSGDEDCLYLNVHRPSAMVEADGALPVMVYLHGGGLTSGAGSLFNGSDIAASQNAVLVTTNYRLGALGMLARHTRSPAGNFAYLDQRSALRWVQREIGAFGGDPNRVLLFGESAGATSVCQHMALPDSYSLFAAALTESAYSCDTFYSLEEALAITDTFAGAAGCSGSTEDIDSCLMAMSVEEIANASSGIMKFPHPTIDGVHWTEPPMQTLIRGDGANLPYVGGSNTDEASFFVPDEFLSAEDYVNDLSNLLNDPDSMLDEALSLYPANQTGDNRLTYIKAFTHQAIQCCTRRVAQAMAKSNYRTVYLYHFDATDECNWDPAVYGVPHTAELDYVFNQWNTTECVPDEPGMTFALSAAMQEIWAGLARDGAVPDEFQWPAWRTDNGVHSFVNEYHFVKGSAPFDVEKNRDAQYCEFWNRDSPFSV